MVITHEENGLLVPVGDEKAMESAMNRLIEHSDFAEKLGRKAAEIGKIAGADQIFREWEAYLEKICDR